MDSSNFMGLVVRLSNINRWSLNRLNCPENLAEHSFYVAIIAHQLALLENKFHGGHYDLYQVVMGAIFHDIEEVVVGDLPTPTKYSSIKMKEAYDSIADEARKNVVNLAPYFCKSEINDAINAEDISEYNRKIIKAADKLAAWIKILQERTTGNTDLDKAGDKIFKDIEALQLQSVDEFISCYMGGIGATLDELLQPKK